jgi:sugar/nucleoside kinase (ribokinase family)
MDDLIPYVDILIVARLFASRHTGHKDPLQAGPELLKYGAKFVVITDGENGSWYCDKIQHFFQPAYKIAVKDTTGAGDTFHGAYLYAMLQAMSARESLSFASAVAALKCTQPGGRTGIPTYQTAIKFLKNQSDQ